MSWTYQERLDLSHLTETQVAWLAGLLEGEGCFSIVRDCYPRVILKMTDQDIVERAALMLKTKVTPIPREGYKTQYGIALGTGRAVEVMKKVRPLMGKRRGARIDELIERWLQRR